MDLETLKSFVQAAEHGSLTRASIALSAMPSALSRRISALEAECGGSLLRRTGRGVTLTELGESVMPRVKELLADFESLTLELTENAGVPKGGVRIGLLISLSQPVVASLFRQVRERHPGIRLTVFGTSNGKMDEWLADGFIDIAVLYRYGKTDAAHEHPLGVVDTYLVGAPGDALTRAPSVNFASLHGLPLILPAAPNGMRSVLEQTARRLKVDLNVVMETSSLPVFEETILPGGVYTVFAGYAANQGARGGPLQMSRIVDPGIERILTLAVSPRPASLAAREVARILRHTVEDAADQIGMRQAHS